MTEFLVMKGIHKGYPGVVALAGVDFDLGESEVHVIVGETPSGYRSGHGPIVVPNCVQMANTRPRVAAAVATRSEQLGEATVEAVSLA